MLYYKHDGGIMQIEGKTIALLIDSDNISHDYFTILMEELNKFGTVTYRRIYGDFTTQNANGWRPLLQEYAIEPMQQYAGAAGKNSTDSAMIIDAMDILYTEKVDCFCLATSDSDFTKLATRLRNANIVVIGAGEQKTPQSFRAACSQFLLMDTLLATSKGAKQSAATVDKKSTTTAKKTAEKADEYVGYTQDPQGVLSLKKLIELAKQIIKENDDDGDGWMNYGLFIQQLRNRENSFNPRNYCGENKRELTFFKDLPNKPFTIEVGGNKQRIKVTRACSRKTVIVQR
jgi:uncharacterized LabA/DUF88 family protein